MKRSIVSFMMVTVALLMASSVAFAAAQAGYRDFSYGVATNPTGNKPQSKLWYTSDGTWWGVLFNKITTDYDIYRFDKATQSWSDTGTLVDPRNNSNSDALWDGTNLYVATVTETSTGTDQKAYLRRYSYDAQSGTYSLDAGFPAVIGSGPMEALNIAKESTGELWATFTRPDAQGVSHVYVNHSQGSDATSWATPYVLPVSGSTIKADDISGIIAFDLKTQAPQIGVMWSNQIDSVMYFSSHKDGDPDTSWSPSVKAYSRGNKSADDHINLKALESDPSGRVFAVTKTAFGDLASTPPTAPQIEVLVLGQDDSFSHYAFSRVQDDQTRPILMIDETHRTLYVFVAGPNTTKYLNEPRAIYYKTVPLDRPSFPVGQGTPFIKSSLDTAIDDATSTKQNVNVTSGLLVLATDHSTEYYLHNFLNLSAADNTPPTIDIATPSDGATYALGQAVNADYSCTDESGGSGLQSCTGTVASGSPIDTSTVGTRTFTVTATDNAGNTVSSTPSYTIVDTQAAACTITGTSANDTLNGTSRNDVICGLGGNDTIKGLGGNDTLRGEEGNDTLVGGQGDDSLDGGLGTDTASFSGSTAVSVSLAAGMASGQGSDTLTGIENLTGSSSDDQLSGSDEANILKGGGGIDTLRGGAGNDQVIGGDGADSLFGEEGDDLVTSRDGVSGNDSLDGGAGTDTKKTDATEQSIVGFP